MLAGASVISPDGLCPPFDASLNKNLFQHLFGIGFNYENHSRIRGIMPFEFARCFGFINNLTYRLSQSANKFSLDTAVPRRTSAWLFEQVHAHLTFIRDSNCEIFSPNEFAVPAATIQAFINGAIGARLLSHARWVEAYATNPDCCAIRDIVTNPGKICKETLKSQRHPLLIQKKTYTSHSLSLRTTC